MMIPGRDGDMSRLTNDGWGSGKPDLRPGRAGVRPQPHPSTRETTPGRERSRAVSRLDLSHNHGGRRSRPQPGAPLRGDARSRAGPGGRECDWVAGPLGQAPWNGPLPGGRSDWRDDPRYCRKNEKKSGPPTRGHAANVSMMNSPGPGWAYMPWKTISPCETMVRPMRPPSGTRPTV